MHGSIVIYGSKYLAFGKVRYIQQCFKLNTQFRASLMIKSVEDFIDAGLFISFYGFRNSDFAVVVFTKINTLMYTIHQTRDML